MFTATDYEKVNTALEEAKKISTATIKLAVVASSNHYQEYVLSSGLLIGSLVSFFVWYFDIVTFFPWLLTIQLAILCCVDITPFLRHIIIRLLPTKILHHYAARMAFQEYHAHHLLFSPQEPFVLLFISLKEHYVQIITNSVIHTHIPDNWNAVIDHFIKTLPKEGLCEACVQAVNDMGKRLTPLQHVSTEEHPIHI